MVVYVNNFDGKTKKDNRPFHTVTLIDVRIEKDDAGELYVSARSKDFFTPTAIDCSDLMFGDVVKCTFRESQYLGAPPDLVALSKVEDSPFDFAKYLQG